MLLRATDRTEHPPTLNIAETQTQHLVSKIDEFLRGIEARYREMVLRWTQILSDCENVDAAGTEVPKHFDQFVAGFTQADHDSALSHHAGRELLGIFQQSQRPFIARARSDGAVQPRHGFCVVVEDVWFGIEDDAQRLFEPLEIRDQYLNSAIRRQFANFADRFRKNTGAAYVVVITIHAGYHRV